MTTRLDLGLGHKLPEVAKIAQAAGREIMAVYQSDFAVKHKDDQSPLTEADLAAHRLIERSLGELDGLPLLSEESADIPFETRSQWQTYWLVDPLDGTKEFIKRNDEFTVNIALIHEHVPVLGVVYAPALNVLYFAAQHEGAYKQVGDAQPVPIACRELDPQHLVIASSRSHAGEALQKFLAHLGSYEAHPMGSSLKFCLIAEGQVDLYPRLGPTSEWDTAAAQCVVEQAGGQVTDTQMRRLQYNTKASLLNPHFFVFGKTWTDWSEFL